MSLNLDRGKSRISLLFVDSLNFFFHRSPDFPLSGFGRSVNDNKCSNKQIKY